MTKEELKNLKAGDVITVPYIVQIVNVEKDIVVAQLPRVRLVLGEAARYSTVASAVFYAGDVEPEKSTKEPEKSTERRKFKYNDLVKIGDEIYVLEKDEGVDGQVVLFDDLYVKGSEVTLLLPAEEVEKLTEWKGGRDD